MRREQIIEPLIKFSIQHSDSVKAVLKNMPKELSDNLKKTLNKLGQEMQQFIRLGMKNTPKAPLRNPSIVSLFI